MHSHMKYYCVYDSQGKVLILVVMEDALAQLMSLKRILQISCVLILVVMEDALAH